MDSPTPSSQPRTPAAKPTLVLVALWGVSHFAPMVEVGKRLLLLAGGGRRSLAVRVLVVPPPTGKWELEISDRIRRDEASGLDIHFRRLPATEPPTGHTGIEELVSRYVRQYAPHVTAAIVSATGTIAAVVVDIFCTTLLDAAREVGVPAYVFLTSSAAMAALLLRSPWAHDVARGLERSGHRFLWVLRGPPEPGTKLPTDAAGSLLAELLPAGFVEGTRERGLVWPTRAPQKEVLAHAAVGGFVTHCGWSSVLESLWSGVPMLPWPNAAEQRFNAFTLVAEMRVAVAMEVDRRRGNFVEAGELERAVRALMGDGDTARKVRERSMEMMAACRRAVAHGGSSVVCLERLYDALIQGAVHVHPKK